MNPGIQFLMIRAASAAGATVLDHRLIRLPHPALSDTDSPPGGTAWVGLDESHVTIHWYEDDEKVYFALDAFTCGTRASAETIVAHILTSIDGVTGEGIQIDRFQGQQPKRAVAERSAQD